MFFPYHDENPTQRFPWVTVTLIAINVYVHLHIAALPEEEQEVRYFQYGFVPVTLTQLYWGRPVAVDSRYLPARLRQADERSPRPWWGWRLSEWTHPTPQKVLIPPQPATRVFRSMITSMFLHGGWLHLLGNMWFFWIFGNNVEDRLGPLRFLLFYLLGGIAAVLCHYLANPMSPIPVVGASGAISAALGAYAITWPLARVRCLVLLFPLMTTVEIPAFLFLGFWFLGQISGVLSPQDNLVGGIAWWAHIGGFLAGIVLMTLLAQKEHRWE